LTKVAYPLKLPSSIKRAAERLAKEDGVSLNQWIAAAVAEKVGVMESARDFLAGRAEGGSAAALKAYLAAAPDVVPDPPDRL
jgi:hypothetical protein